MNSTTTSINRNIKKGFTIVELLIVIVVIGILAAISIVAYNGIQNRAHSTSVASDLNNNAKKLEEFKILNGHYPVDRDEFRSADLTFTLPSGRYAIYCATDSPTEQNWALIISPTGGGDGLYRTNSSNTKEYTGDWAYATTSCDHVGISSPTLTRWLRASGDWGDWVVY